MNIQNKNIQIKFNKKKNSSAKRKSLSIGLIRPEKNKTNLKGIRFGPT